MTLVSPANIHNVDPTSPPQYETEGNEVTCEQVVLTFALNVFVSALSASLELRYMTFAVFRVFLVLDNFQSSPDLGLSFLNFPPVSYTHLTLPTIYSV